MAIRATTPKLLRHLSSAASSPSTATISPHTFSHPTPSSPSPIIDLSDPQSLFSSIPTPHLLRAVAVLNAVSVDPIVDLGTWIMRSRLMESPLTRDVILGAVRRTVYEQFVAGRDVAETGRTMERIAESGLRGMLVYGAEHADENEGCERNWRKFMDTIEAAGRFPRGSVSFVILKVSAIVPIGLLRRVSDLLRWERKDPSISLPWKGNTLPIFVDSSPLYHTLQRPDPLTPQEERDLELGHQRMLKLCKRSAELNVPLTIDAEETTVEPAINYLTYSSILMSGEGGNRTEPMLYGTIQAYLKDSMERLVLTSKAAEKMGVPIGFKLVRGAYMSFERKLAASLGFDSPVHDNIYGTHDSYNRCASYMIDKVADRSGAIILATHNVESGRLAAEKARDLGLGKDNERLEFAQLYGMSEALSYSLKNAGFLVSKYLTFGPVEEVIPYLLRRAEENRGILSSSFLDRELMRKELTRRVKAWFVH
ncbi:Proline dehydrogenase 2, mitochondrial-like protein [Drosera capensis]